MAGARRLNPLLSGWKDPPPICLYHTDKLRGLATLAGEGWYGWPHSQNSWFVLS